MKKSVLYYRLRKYNYSLLQILNPNKSEQQTQIEHVVISFKTVKEAKGYLSKYYNQLLEAPCPVTMSDLPPGEKLIVLRNIAEAMIVLETHKLKCAKFIQTLRISLVTIGLGLIVDSSFRSSVKKYSGKDRTYFDANQAEDVFVHAGTFILAGGISYLLYKEVNKDKDVL
jgi:hypothetical protein